MSIEALQTPQVASNNDTAGAIQIAGEVMMYDNIGLQLNRTFLQSDIQQLPTVSGLIIMYYTIDAGAVCMRCVYMCTACVNGFCPCMQEWMHACRKCLCMYVCM